LLHEWGRVTFLQGKGQSFSMNIYRVILALSVAYTVFFFLSSQPVWAGPYADSAHGQNVTRAVTAAAGYAVGNCAHCHEQHASFEGTSHTPGSYLKYVDLSGDAFCNSCHDGSETVKDIATNWNAGTYGHGPLAGSMGCAECHDPHTSLSVHSPAVDGNNALTVGSVIGTSGVEPTWPAVSDPTPGTSVSEAALAPLSFTTKDPIEKEYQLCFLCHSNPSVNGDNPKTLAEMTNVDGLDLTLVAAQFNPNQYSHHPVTGTGNWRNPNVNAGLLSPWNAVANDNARMYCTDCHGDSGAAGAHSSNAKYMLKATGHPDNPAAPDCYDNLCFICHSTDYDGGGGGISSPWSHGSNGAHQYEGESNGDNRLGCGACHGGPAGYAGGEVGDCFSAENGGKRGAIHGETFYWQLVQYDNIGTNKNPICGTTPIVGPTAQNPADHFLVGGYNVGMYLDDYHGGNDGDGTCYSAMGAGPDGSNTTDGCASMGNGQGW